MAEKELTNLTDEELQKQWKKAKNINITMAVFIGILIGTSVYGAVKNGFTFFTIFPLLLIPVFVNAQKQNKALEREMKARKLK